MQSQSFNSINFVINVVYTITFGNSLYLSTVSDASKSFALDNMSITYSKALCGLVCIIMTFRFFFGNNQYIYETITDSSKGPWVKFYHFLFIVVQSIILLYCSYCIPSPQYFVNGIMLLFAIEVIWYLGSFIIDIKGVWYQDKNETRKLLYAELTNFFFVLGTFISTLFSFPSEEIWLSVVFGLFILNTAYDAKLNMVKYMA